MEGKDGVDGWGLFCNGARAGALLQVLYRCSTARCCSKLQILATLGFLFALWDQIMDGFSSSSDSAQRRGKGRGMKVACRLSPSLPLDTVDIPCFLSARLSLLHVPLGPGCRSGRSCRASASHCYGHHPRELEGLYQQRPCRVFTGPQGSGCGSHGWDGSSPQ